MKDSHRVSWWETCSKTQSQSVGSPPAAADVVTTLYWSVLLSHDRNRVTPDNLGFTDREHAHTEGRTRHVNVRQLCHHFYPCGSVKSRDPVWMPIWGGVWHGKKIMPYTLLTLRPCRKSTEKSIYTWANVVMKNTKQSVPAPSRHFSSSVLGHSHTSRILPTMCRFQLQAATCLIEGMRTTVHCYCHNRS